MGGPSLACCPERQLAQDRRRPATPLPQTRTADNKIKPAGFPVGAGVSGDTIAGQRSYKYVGVLGRAKVAGCWVVSPFLLSTDPVAQGSRFRYLRCASAWLQTAPPALGRLCATVLSNHFGPASFSKGFRLAGYTQQYQNSEYRLSESN